MSRCFLVATHFPPFQSAGTFRSIRIAKYLPELGWDLEVLTVDPASYLEGSRISQESLSQISQDIKVHRTRAAHPNQWLQAGKKLLTRNSKPISSKERGATPKSASVTSTKEEPSSGMVQRAKDAVTVPLMTPDRWIGWMPFAVRKGKRALAASRCDLLYSSGPPWTNHLIARRLKQTHDVAWVADFRDPWVGNNFRPQRRGDTWVGRKHRELESKVIRFADGVIFNTARACDEAQSRYPDLPSEKFCVIPNGFDPADFSSAPPASVDGQGETNRRPLRLVHTGAFYGKRNVDALLVALGELRKTEAIGAEDIELVLIGAAGRDHEKRLAADLGITKMVNVRPSIPHSECLTELYGADVLLLVQTDAPLCVPGKLYEYLAVGRPVFTLAGDGATADIVRKEGVGPCVSPQDNDELKRVVLDLVHAHRNGGVSIAEGVQLERYDGRAQMRLFDAAFRRAMEAQRA